MVWCQSNSFWHCKHFDISGSTFEFFFQKLDTKSAENKKSFFFTILSNICCLLLCGFIFRIFVSSNLINGVCKYESNYFCIRVLTTPLSELCKTGNRLLKTNNICGLDKNKDSNEKISILFLDNLLHSYNSQINPSLLVYEYERVYAKVFDYAQKNKLALNTIFIGGGGYTFPRYVESIDTKSSIEVIEIDPLVTQTAYKELGLSAQSRILSHIEDARTFFSKQIKVFKANKLNSKKYDLIFGDAFRDISIPYHLVTKEFNDIVKASLQPYGLYVVNVVDGKMRNYRFLRSYLKTIKRSFDYVYLLPSRKNWKQDSTITFVVIASDKPLNETSWSKSIDTLPGQNMIINGKYLNQAEMKELLSLDNKAVLLTDMYSPVEQMMAPTIARGKS
jgi:spermidine synthase